MTDVQDSTTGSEPSMEEILASIRRIIADEKEPEAEAAPAAEPEQEEPIVELTQAVKEDGSVVDVKDEDPEIEMAPIETEIAEPPAPKPAAKTDDGLVSSDAAQAASSSLASLASKVETERMASIGSSLIGNGGRTLEDMVMELMKPMLKAWLDENLPPIVERIVQKEVERIARRND